MKAKEILQRYAKGERNFQRVNLRGQSFQGADLSGADFSEADIRGTNFKGAILRGANFSQAKAGLQKRWVVGLTLIALIVSSVSGFLAAFGGGLIALAIDEGYDAVEKVIIGGISLLIIGGQFLLTIKRGVITGAVAVAGAFAVAVAGAFAVAGAVLGVNGYVAWRAMRGDERDAWIRTVALAFAATGGTSFYGADLTDANFTKAIFKSTDLRAKSLIRICWQDAIKLDYARVGKTYLAQAAVRDLLITRDGYKKSYVGANLEGANLAGVNLEQANLKRANLSQATFQGANLKEANLAQTLALGANYTHAYLTGACLEAWTIDETTILSNVDCQYIFFLEYPNHLGSRERRPHDPDKVFAPGDFEKLYQEVINTIQILLRDGINRESFAAAFQKIMADFPEINPDSIQGMEKRGDDVILTLAVEEDTDKGKLEHTFTEVYEARLEAAKNAALLEAEQRHAQDIKEMTIAALVSHSSSVTITNSNTAESKAMSNSKETKGINIEGTGGNVNLSNVNLNLDNVNSTVTNSINELPANPEPDQPSVKELLTQLQNAINEEENLDPEDKAEALTQVQTLAEAGKDPQNNQKLAKRATTMLRGIIAGLPSAAMLVQEASTLIPMIAGLFGL
jgi:uncharacterized protein YjbI with pentapeptide repeats